MYGVNLLIEMHTERATDLFQSEGAPTSENQCRQKIAQFAAEVEKYQKAVEIYEDIGRQSLKNNLLKYGIKGHLLNAGICQLCKGDVVAINNALERYELAEYQISIYGRKQS